MFYWAEKKGKFPAIDRSPLLFCCSDQCIFVDLLQIKDEFHCQESIIIHGVSAYERA